MSVREEATVQENVRNPFRRDSILTMVDDELEMVSADDGQQRNFDTNESLLENAAPVYHSLPRTEPVLQTRRKPLEKEHIPSRLVNKNGSYCVEHLGLPEAQLHYWRNLILTLIEIRWRWVWITVFAMYPATWIAFAIVFYSIAYHHGDFDDYDDGNGSGTQPVPCVGSVNDFVSMLLFSMESQQTIGYGYRFSTDRCGLLLFFLGIQYIVGAVLTACLCAIIWARILRPRRRAQEVLFSRNAVITTNQEGELCLMFRISDIAGSHLVQTVIHMYMAKKWAIPHHPEKFSFRLCHMSMGEDVGRDKLVFLWPTVVYHIINKHSPLYNYTREIFETADLEFIACVEGIVEATGLTFQVRSSYLTNEVLWGHRFQAMNFCGEGRRGKITVHYNDFDTTFPTPTPICSAKDLDAHRRNHTSLV